MSYSQLSGPSSFFVSSCQQWSLVCPPVSLWRLGPKLCQWQSVSLFYLLQHWWGFSNKVSGFETETCSVPAVHKYWSLFCFLLSFDNPEIVEDGSSILWYTVIRPGGEVILGHLKRAASLPVALKRSITVFVVYVCGLLLIVTSSWHNQQRCAVPPARFEMAQSTCFFHHPASIAHISQLYLPWYWSPWQWFSLFLAKSVARNQ